MGNEHHKGVGGQSQVHPVTLAIVSTKNIIEHTVNDGQSLSDSKVRVCPGGRIAVWVRARELSCSPFDYEVGCCPRHSRKGLRAIPLSVSFKCERLSFVNAAGGVAWKVVATLCESRPAFACLTTFRDQEDRMSIASIDGKLPFTWGQSLVLIARVSDPRNP